MKKIIWIAVAVVLVGIGGYWALDNNNTSLGRSSFSNTVTLAGSETNFVSLPRSASFSNSTTTDAANSFATGAQKGFLDGGQVITQSFDTDGHDWAVLEIAAKAGTATSTLYGRLQVYDGTDWSDAHASSTPSNLAYNTSTSIVLSPMGFQIDPGLVSTTLTSLPPLYTYGFKQARIIMYADDLTTDPNDGVQIWAKVIKIDPFQR